jgi:hypothetical protein
MMELKFAKKNNKKLPEVWISGSEWKHEDIECLKKELSAQNHVIDRQRQTIQELKQELNTKKSIVADWLEPPIASPKHLKGSDIPDAREGYIAINVGIS